MSGYKQATSAQVRQVVGKMVEEGLDERSREVKALIESVEEYGRVSRKLYEVVAALERKVETLEAGGADQARLTGERFDSIRGRLDKTQAAVASLTERIAGAVQTVSAHGRQTAAVEAKLDQVNRRMDHIEEVLLKNREEAINRLAQQIGKAIAKHVVD